tara:strand:+ start:985 stop:2067 length:1083 start_codon:yes stop_codon:yes gene_type:complete
MARNNNRIFYAVHAVGLAKFATTGVGDYKAASGVQSVGINTTFNLEQVFQLGQIEIYENVENIPDVEVTIEKVLDGATLIQHLATADATVGTLAGRYNNNRAMVNVAYYDDANSNASGVPLAQVHMSGMYVSSMSFSLPTDGNFTESCTLVGNDKTWSTGVAGDDLPYNQWGFGPTSYTDTGAPVAASGVQRRENLVMSGCIFPTEIPGMTQHTVYGAGKGQNLLTGDKHAVHMQSINVATDLGRTELFELGKRGPYHRFADFPTEVTCSFEIVESELGDFIDAAAEGTNITDQTIFLLCSDGTRLDLGSNNKLASISSSGGETGGGNRTSTYNYSNFNKLTVSAKLDVVQGLKTATNPS